VGHFGFLACLAIAPPIGPNLIEKYFTLGAHAVPGTLGSLCVPKTQVHFNATFRVETRHLARALFARKRDTKRLFEPVAKEANVVGSIDPQRPESGPIACSHANHVDPSEFPPEPPLE